MASYYISDYNEHQILITNLVQDWLVPKFRILMSVTEPYLYLYWNDRERGTGGDERLLILNYLDVVDGYGGYVDNPQSAQELADTIDTMIVSGFGGGGGDILTAKADLLSHDGVSDTILAGGTNEYILSRDDNETTGLKWIAKSAILGGQSAGGDLQGTYPNPTLATNLRKETYFFQMGGTTFADSTTYYFGNQPFTPITALPDRAATYFRRAGTITIAELAWTSYAVAGSNENISIYIRINNTTDHLIATVGDANARKTFTNTSLAVSVVSGDYFFLKVVTPAWVTNPTTTYMAGYLVLSY